MLENSNAVGALLETYTTAQTVICSEQNGKCFRPRSFHLVFAYIGTSAYYFALMELIKFSH